MPPTKPLVNILILSLFLSSCKYTNLETPRASHTSSQEKGVNKSDTAEHQKDNDLKNRIKIALTMDTVLKNETINIDVVSGVITLHGSLNTPSDCQRAVIIAAHVQGVKRVINHLALKPNHY